MSLWSMRSFPSRLKTIGGAARARHRLATADSVSNEGDAQLFDALSRHLHQRYSRYCKSVQLLVHTFISPFLVSSADAIVKHVESRFCARHSVESSQHSRGLAKNRTESTYNTSGDFSSGLMSGRRTFARMYQSTRLKSS